MQLCLIMEEILIYRASNIALHDDEMTSMVYTMTIKSTRYFGLN